MASTDQGKTETTPGEQSAQTTSTTTSGQVSVQTTSGAQLSSDTTVSGTLSGTMTATPDVEPPPTPTVATEPPAPALSVGANVGELAPDFQLPAASGADSSLASYRGDKNVVVVFYRAFW